MKQKFLFVITVQYLLMNLNQNWGYLIETVER